MTLENAAYEPVEEDEASLIESARTDSRALSILYRRHYAAIYGYVYRRIGNSHDANDVVAETFLSMVRYLPQFRWTGAPFRAWLLRIATTQINRWARRRNWTRLWSRVDETHPSAVEPHAESDARLEQLRQALWKLPTRLQTVLALHYLEEQSLEAIGEILNCPVGTVKSRLARGRDALRAVLIPREEKLSDEQLPNEQRAIGLFPQRAEV